MARLLFPDESVRLAYRLIGTQINAVPGGTVLVFSDAGATQLADIEHLDNTPVTGSALTVDAYGLIPQFQGPASGVTTLYAVINGGPIVTLVATDPGQITAAIASTLGTAEAFATSAVGAETTRAVAAETANAAAISTETTNRVSAVSAAITTAEGFATSAVAAEATARATAITNAINALINGAPGALDTLNELAAALGNDASFATDVTNSIALKVAKASNGSDFADAGTTRLNLHVPALVSCQTAAAGNLALSGLQTVNGYTLVDGDQILLTAQTTGSQNGPWVAHSGSWTRPTDYATAAVVKGRTVQVVDTNNVWGLKTTASITVDTTSTTWALVGSGTYVQTHATGIVADGTTDNSAVLNALIAALNAAGGGHIVLPSGNIKLASPLTPLNNVTISGQGFSTVLLPYGTNAAFYTAAPTSAAPLTNWHMRDLAIDGTNQSGTYDPSIKGFHCEFLYRCSFQNLLITNTYATGLGIDFLREVVVVGVICDNTGRGNDGTQPGGNGIGIGTGGYTDVSEESFLVTGCSATNVKRFGIMLERQGSINARGAKIIGNYATGCGSGGFLDSGATGALFMGNYGYNNVGPNMTVGPGTYGTIPPGYAGRITGNYFFSGQSHGILFDASGSGPAAATYEITGNYCYNNAASGIMVKLATADLTYIRITNNECYHNNDAGIFVQTTSTGKLVDCVISNNNCPENGQNAGSSAKTGIRIDCNMSGGEIKNNTEPGGPQTSGIAILSGRTLTSVAIKGNSARGISLALNVVGTLTTCEVTDNVGYNPLGPAAISVGASPFTYTAGPTPENVYIDGGTVSLIVKGSTTLRTSTGATVALRPNEAVVVTYSSAPTITKDRQ